MTYQPLAVLACIALTGNLLVVNIASATPAFSRQIQADCRACHTMGNKALNRFGRQFKQNAFNESSNMRDKRMREAHGKKSLRQDS
ncbi:MAG: hypothetical protein Q9M23_08775 [Mariprofundaceae bacterium]|nr:hypothetical protein [Mariprofundaceae bacterium]